MLSHIGVIILVVSAASALKPLPKGTTSTNVKDAGKSGVWLLPDTVTPVSYDLALKTHVESFNDENPTFQFEGTVKILVDVKGTGKSIVLHKAESLTIIKATLSSDTGTKIDTELDFTQYDATTNKLTLSSVDDIVDGNHIITIEYHGVHDDNMHGFYRSSYVNSNNETKWLVTTQFEAYDARKAFPCFDEPKYKAKYTISISVANSLINEQNYTVLSNMDLDTATEVGDQMVYKFKEFTLPISSYLVAFIVSDFVGSEVATFDGEKEFKTYGQSRYISNGEGATSQLAGPAVLEIINKLVGMPFPLPKLDQVGIPDFSAGAMENMGLVTYRERIIFYNETKNPISQKQSVVTVTAHELAHQWFGDVVTLHWWSDIWLNEGFATFFEYHATDQIRLEGLNTSTWKIINQMVVDELQAGAFVTDAQLNSRALTSEVYKPGDIDANFDDVAYSKGGSVIRMWMHTLGEDKFYTALGNYLSANKGSVGTPELLLQSFDDVIDADSQVKPTQDFADYHKLPGYPILLIEGTGNNHTITQKRYLVSEVDPTPDINKWTIPITYTTANESDFETTIPKQVFKKSDPSISIDHGNVAWVIYNIQQTGYYRVNYNEEGWKALRNALLKDHTVIHEINRAQILDDAFWGARSSNNYTSYDIALNISTYLTKETELVPWKAALNSLSFLYGKVASDATHELKMKAYILSLVENIFTKLTLKVEEDDSHTTRLLRPLIASWACKLGNKDCIATADTLFQDSLKDGADVISPDVKNIVVCTAVRKAPENWETVWEWYQNTNDNSEQTIYLSALGCSADSDTLNGYLNKTLEPDSGIRKQDLTAVFSAVYNGNPSNVQVALNFLKNNLEAIGKSYGGLNPLGGLLTGIAAKLGTQSDVDMMNEINDEIMASSDLNLIAAQSSSAKALEIVQSNKVWLDLKLDAINNWIDIEAPTAKPGGAGALSITMFTLLFPAILALIFTH